MREIKVEGMSCAHCVRAVTQAVAGVDPQAQVAVDLAGGVVRIEGGQAEDAAVRKAIRDAGYEPAA